MTYVERPSAESLLLAKLQQHKRANLRVYIGAAPGVGKTYQMLEDAHRLKQQGVDIVTGVIDTHGREETATLIGDLERVRMRRIQYRTVVIEEMDLEGVIERRPEVALVDDLAHTNLAGSKNRNRYEDVLDLLDAGISIFTAVNIQHIESLNDAIARTTGVHVRETFPDWFLKRG
jgi:two-component system sensor histidine kinase KdpD